MEITYISLPVEIILAVVFLAGAFAYFMDLIVGINERKKSKPGFPGSGSVSFFIKPSVIHTCYHCKCKHTGP